MAHFAKIGLDNVVLAVVVVNNADTATDGGLERESIGVAHLAANNQHQTWKQCSYNTREGQHMLGGTAFRANMPSKGWYYDSTNDIFYPPRPTDKDGDSCGSWTLNTTTGVWGAPLTEPTTTTAEKNAMKYYAWDESAYQANNSQGWILITP